MKTRWMIKVESKIKDYKKDNKIYDIDGNVTNMVSNLTGLESKLNSNILEINILNSQKEYFAKQLSVIEMDLVSQMLNSINAQLFALRTQVHLREEELITNAIVYGDDHEAVLSS